MSTVHRSVQPPRDRVTVRALRISHAYLRLLHVLDELVASGVMRRGERQLLRDTADALLFGDADGDEQLIRAERAFAALLGRDVLDDQEVSTLRERLWDIESVH
jgi:hypothetical protein